MTEANKQTKKELLIQFIKFGIVGVTNTLVSYVINVVTLFLLGKAHLFQRWDYMIANCVAFILSVLWSFYWNNKLVFNMEGTSWMDMLKALLKMYLSYAFTGIILSNVLSYLWIDVLHISKFIAPLINSVIGVPINFVLNKFWAFQGK
mgnify:CR=1 FL=1